MRGDRLHRHIAALFGALLILCALAAPAQAAPNFGYQQARGSLCQGLQPYAEAWFQTHGFVLPIVGASSGVDANGDPRFLSFVRDDGASWRVQCQWIAAAAPGYDNPYAAPGQYRYARVAATGSVGGSVYTGLTIAFSSVSWFYLGWMDPNCPQCWENVPYGTRLPA